MIKVKNDEKIPTIVVCIDTANASEVTLRYAFYRARSGKFAVQILAVLESSHKNLPFGAKTIARQKRQQLEKHLKKLISTAGQETGIIPSISICEGDIVTEIIREIKAVCNCTMLVFGKSHNSLSDNTILPKIMGKIGKQINIPVTIVPENLSDEFLKKLA
jgi:K+-sensing histidine kinase KdpD